MICDQAAGALVHCPSHLQAGTYSDELAAPHPLVVPGLQGWPPPDIGSPASGVGRSPTLTLSITQRRRRTVSEPVFMAQIRAADIPESMPVSRAIRDFMVAHPPTPEGQLRRNCCSS